jgi:NAD-dependent DNA ligase
MSRQNETDEQKFVRLGWWIIEQKFRYYVLGAAIVPDEVYDIQEMEYQALAVKLGKKPTASEMVGFAPDRPSCRLVAKKVMEEMK